MLHCAHNVRPWLLWPNVAGERRPTRDDAAEAAKSLPGGPSVPVAG
jgi:hypothetical protein